MLPGNTLLNNDRYRIIRPLGRGGMGHVYEAIDNELARIVAIKETFADTVEMRDAFEREAKLLANLNHPALPKVSSHFFEGNGQFLVMDYIEGNNLLELLDAHKNIAPDESAFRYKVVLLWADILLDVLEYLHNRSEPIIHRDIKPTNIKRSHEGKIFLLDFGLAKGVAGQMTTVRDGEGPVSIYGYSQYYSPMEQISRAGTDAQSDLHALGATLYHLLTGETPVPASKRYERVDRGLLDPLIPPHELNPKVPLALSRIVLYAMEVSRKDRIKSATQMRRALQDAASAIESAGQGNHTPTAPPMLPSTVPSAPDERARIPSAVTEPLQVSHTGQEIGENTEESQATPPPTPPAAEVAHSAHDHPPVNPLTWEKEPEKVDQLAPEEGDSRDTVSDPETRRYEDEIFIPAISEVHEEQIPEIEEDRSPEPVWRAAEQDQLGNRNERETEQAETVQDDEETYKEAEARVLKHRWVAEVEQRRKNIAEAAKAAFLKGTLVTEKSLKNDPEQERVEVTEGNPRLTTEHLRGETVATAAQITNGSRVADSSAESETKSETAGGLSATPLKFWRALSTVRRKRLIQGAVVLLVMGFILAVFVLRKSPSGPNNTNVAPAPSQAAPTTSSTALSKPSTASIRDASSPVSALTLNGQGKGVVWATAFSPDGNLLAGAGQDGNIRVWDAKTKALKYTLSGHQGDVYSIAFSSDSKTLASAGKDKTVKLWDVERGAEIKTLTGHLDEVYYLAFSPDGSRLASTSKDKTIKLWDVHAQQVIRSIPSGKALAVAFSPDEPILASAGSDKAVRRWNVENGLEVKPPFEGHRDALLSIAFSPDGKFLASGSKDGVIKVWDAETGREKATLTGHTGFITSLAFSPDNKVLVSASMDRTVRLWDTDRWSLIRKLTENTKGVTSVSFSAVGSAIISGGEDGTVRLWEWS